MKSLLNLHVERLDKPTAISFDVRPQAVKSWVDALPMGHVGEATRQIYTALRETNALEVESKLRFDLLEALWGPVHAILPALYRHFSLNQFPLPKKAQKVAQLSTDLLSELLIAYRLTMDAREGATWFGRKAQKRQKATCAHRLLHYLQAVLDNYRVLNLPAPKGLWRELHRIYIEASQQELMEEAVAAPDSAEATTIGREYKQILLLSMLPNHLLRPDQRDAVIRSMDVWTSDLQLAEPGRADEHAAPYCILLHMDMPPIPNDARCRKLQGERSSAVLFDASRIRQRIAAHLSASAPVVSIGRASIALDTLSVLARSWGEPPARLEERQIQNFEVQVAIGLSAIHYLMRLQSGALTKPEAAATAAPAAPAARQEAPKNIEDYPFPNFGDDFAPAPKPTVKRGEFIASNQHNDDTWGQIFDQAAVQKDWTETGREKEYRAVPGQVQDASENGYRISLAVRDVEQLKMGDIVGVYESSVSEWRIGSARWVRQESEEELQLGVQVHMAAAIPLEVKVRVGSTESAPQRCLLGLEAGDHPILALPSLPGIESKQLSLTDGTVDAGLRLREKIAGSALFEIHRIEVIGAKPVGEVSRCPDLLFALVRRYLPTEPLLAPETKVASEDDYASIWSAL